MNSQIEYFKQLDRIYGHKIAKKLNDEHKEEFQGQFVDNWKKRKENIEQVYNKIEEVEAEIESIIETKKEVKLEIENILERIER